MTTIMYQLVNNKRWILFIYIFKGVINDNMPVLCVQ